MTLIQRLIWLFARRPSVAIVLRTLTSLRWPICFIGIPFFVRQPPIYFSIILVCIILIYLEAPIDRMIKQSILVILGNPERFTRDRIEWALGIAKLPDAAEYLEEHYEDGKEIIEAAKLYLSKHPSSELT